MRGKAVKLGDHINTDFVISGKYKFKTQDIKELSKHIFEDLDPTLSQRIKSGTIIVAGRNFGYGSSREHAPRVIKEVGVSAVIAKSFARIFFRNAINIGLPVIVASESFIDSTNEGDEVSLDLEKGTIKNETKNIEETFKPYPSFISVVMREGGIVSYFKKYGVLPWDTR
jgi:3-isopropylmalate/(R)-2-methylmalate dehydratase small subunit